MGILSVVNSVAKNFEKSFIFTSLVISIILINTKISAENTDKREIEQLPFCDDNVKIQKDINNRFVYITTLDGKLSAIDLLQGGSVKWSVPTGPGPLLSSSIHQLELTKNGQWVRMIPSLSGGLYQFDGDSIEPIPITAENLLSSSFKFSDDLVISGGKETRTYGLSARTGKVIYECSMHGCSNNTETENDVQESSNNINNELDDIHNPAIDDVIVLRRETQTVRAIEPRTGNERWNFSVGHQDLELLKSTDCHTTTGNNLDDTILDLELKVIVPDGIICAVSKKSPNNIIWKYKFDYPIVSAWRNDKNNLLKSINLFESSITQWKINQEYLTSKEIPVSPSLYVGMYMKQLYVQESDHLRKLIHKDSLENIKSKIKYPTIPWKPFPATGSALALIEDDNKDKIEYDDSKLESTSTALSILYASNYVNGNGFFLYTSDDLNKTQTGICDTDDEKQIIETNSEKIIDDDVLFEFTFDGNDTPAKIVIVSLWFWWKEIFVIAITTAVVINVMLSQKLRSEREIVVVERHVEVPILIEKEQSKETSKSRSSHRSLSESNNNNDNFTSRFLNDFDPVQCLGKGGFGVVFEAKNKLDDCNYAIKRIMLPNKQESRERVMREVKTLANCEHQNIVRYFQAWVETPPVKWQEQQDQLLFERDLLSTSIDIDTPTNDLSSVNKLFTNELMNQKNLNSWITNLNTNECINFDDEIRKTKFNSNITNNNNNKKNGLKKNNNNDFSFIQFKNDEFSDSLFDDTSEFEKKHNDYNDYNDDDSFQIEFKNDTKNSISKVSSKNNHNDNRDLAISITSGDSEDDNGDDDNNKKIVPYKRTHRRPLSLDLSSKENNISFVTTTSKMYLYIQMQLCRKQSLKDWLKLNDSMKRQNHYIKIFEQIIGAVEYVHLKGLIHRDLKPSNIFFSLDGQIKIGDFGLVTDTSDMMPINITNDNDNSEKTNCAKHTELVGTHLYMSPEQMEGLPYNYKVDIYSMGLILFELLVVFSTEMERIDTLKKLRSNIFPDDFQKSFQKEYTLLKLMLSDSPHERPTTFGIRARPPLEHSTNSEYHFELPRRHESRTSSISNSSN